MDKRYEVFALLDPQFYETPDRLPATPGNAARPFEAAERPLPEGWRTSREGDWLVLSPPRPNTPAQGWKIHVSACLDNAEKTAAKVWDYCVPRGLPFKFVPDAHQLFLRNSKYAGRASSGKFVTVYPADEEELRAVLQDLDALLGGEPGPYILTDLRYHEGPLYVRYGGFAERHVMDEETGELVTAIEDDRGRLVPDRREPAFRVPEWVTLPEFLAPHLAARNATTVADLPYRIEEALHFSNGGGVYLGTDTRTGEKVVLKEGRPYAGLAADGADAVARLERERTALERLAGLDVAPGLRDWFTLGGHRFLVMDHVEGRTLNSFFAERHPLLAPDPDPDRLAEYTRWALRIHAAVEEAVTAVHERGVVFNDLHMFNIMVRPEESWADRGPVALIDFEAATPAGRPSRQVVAHPGFLAPPDREGFAVDRYALACLRLALFVPMTSLLPVDARKAAHLAEVAAEQFPVPRGFLDEAVRVIAGEEPRRPGSAPASPAATGPAALARLVTDWPSARDSMTRAILASATPDRDDRLFPGDIAQFAAGGGLGIAHGAAGVLYALHRTGAERYEEGERWLLRHTDPPPRGTPLGLYDGLLGVAYVLDLLGHRARALDLVERVLAERWSRLPADLHGGLAGAGLVLHHLARTTGETALAATARAMAGHAVERLRGQGEGRRRAGLLHGATGPALLLLRLYEDGGDTELLDLAAQALRRDLDACVTDRRGTLMVDEGPRLMPYLGAGSVGIAAVLDDHLALRHDEDLARARAAIEPAAHLHYYAQPGLFNGRAGMVWHLARTPGGDPSRLRRQTAAMGWYAMDFRGRLAFPGEQMMRLSMDLATGTAGCLLALGAADLPFLPPPGRPRSRP
ncbi:class III lanthionine synthetase LanKC [Streptomyces capparidis]